MFARLTGRAAAERSPAVETDTLGTATLRAMLDQMPVNVLLADPRTGDIVFVNRLSVETLQSIRHELPAGVDPDRLVGRSMDVFHKAPSHQRRIVADAANLPWRTRIRLGRETLDLRASAIHGSDGAYIGCMVTWSVVTALADAVATFEERVKGAIDHVGRAVDRLRGHADGMAHLAGETVDSAGASAGAAETAGHDVETVAAAVHELDSSISEISRQASASAAVGETARETEIMRTEIDRFVEIIRKI